MLAELDRALEIADFIFQVLNSGYLFSQGSKKSIAQITKRKILDMKRQNNKSEYITTKIRPQWNILPVIDLANVMGF
jgi:hypothetical protein